MKSFSTLLLGCTLALAPCCCTYAVLDPSTVSADSRWLIHVDFNALRHSLLGQQLLELLAKNQPEINSTGIQVDFQKVFATIGQATAFGANFSNDPKMIDGALIIEGTDDLRKIAEGYIAQAEISTPDQVTEIKGLPFEAYSIRGDILVGFPKERIVLVSKMKPQLVAAYEIYRHRGPSLAKGGSSILREMIPNRANTFLIAASITPNEGVVPENSPHARMIKMATAGSVAVGEKDKIAFVQVKLRASSSEMADKLMKIVQGVTAMASLAESNDQHLGDFLKSITIERQDTSVALAMAYPSERLIQMLQDAEEHASHNSMPHPRPLPPTPLGNTIAEWKADQDLGSGDVNEKTLVSHSIENVHLVTGALIRISGQADAGEHARIDCVEIQPSTGNGQPLKFEAEYMKLTGYAVEDVSAASGGKVVKAINASGVAEFQFPGSTGDYTMKVYYSDENDGVSTFSVRVIDPKVENKSK